jgi:hypothetical protein
MRYLHETESEAVKACKRCRFKRRRFFAAGVNEIWAMDQHDKWGPRFGLWLHNCINPFIGINNWLKVWWTNKKPRLIAKFFWNMFENMVVGFFSHQTYDCCSCGLLIQRYH